MEPYAPERCWLCSFWNGSRCTHTFRLTFHIDPVGGQVDFQATPGMVPEEIMPRLAQYFQKLIERVAVAIELMPFWDEVREFQIVQGRSDCPGRKEREEIKPYLKIVPAPMPSGGKEC